jgi:hypothetical protein
LVDSIAAREEQCALTAASSVASAPVFVHVWDNADDVA